MGRLSPKALRVCCFVGGIFLLAVSAGCARSSSHQSESAGRTSAVQPSLRLVLRSGGSVRTVIRGVRIEWQRERDGHVCYAAKLPRQDALGSCIRRLRADEITYDIGRSGKSRQLVIVGVAGPHVEKVYLRFRHKRWTPATSRGAFFGYAPRGKVLSVVKVLKDGSRREFAVNQYSA